MEEDHDEPAVPSPKRLSRTPSWIMLGFLLGVLFVILLPDKDPVEPEPVVQKTDPMILPLPQMTTVEIQFEAYGQHAVWENDTTEVRVWNTNAKAFVDSYEVLRTGEKLYFRSIPRLTRPLLDHGLPENLPLQFTEPEEHRKEWLRAVTNENLKKVFVKPKDP